MITSRVLKSVTVLVAAALLSSGICLSSAASAYANQNPFATDASIDSTKKVQIAKTQVSKDDSIKRIDDTELERLKANLEDAVKEHGSVSWPAFVKGRYLLQWYVEQNQVERAVPLCESLVQYCRESIDDTTSGANGKELTSSAKQDYNNMILCLTVLSELNNQLGQVEKSAELLNEARKTYDDYQSRNYGAHAQSFEQFIELSSVPNAVTQSKLGSMLNWRVY